jgi:hypothetical protein
VEVCLDGVFGREYRKLMSAIPAGFEAERHRKEAERPPERGVRAGGEGRIRCYRDFSSSKRVAPATAPATPQHLPRRTCHLALAGSGQFCFGSSPWTLKDV